MNRSSEVKRGLYTPRLVRRWLPLVVSRGALRGAQRSRSGELRVDGDSLACRTRGRHDLWYALSRPDYEHLAHSVGNRGLECDQSFRDLLHVSFSLLLQDARCACGARGKLCFVRKRLGGSRARPNCTPKNTPTSHKTGVTTIHF